MTYICKKCGKEHENRGHLMQCYKTHNKNEDVEKEPSNVTIPGSICPEELKYFSIGKTVGLKVYGKLTVNRSVEVGKVELIR